MAAIPVSIDLCHNPLRVGYKTAGSFVIQEGSKGANLTGGGHGDSVAVLEVKDGSNIDFSQLSNINASPELVDCLNDARDVAKSYFGTPNIKSAVVVVPNGTDKGTQRSIEAAGKQANIHDIQVIPEHIAVAAAYADKTKPAKTSRITIISSTSGVCDVYVVSVSPKSRMSYDYVVEIRDSDGDEAEDEGDSDSTIPSSILNSINNSSFGGVMKWSENWNMDSSSDKPAFEVAVFVGKSAELKNMRRIIGKGFSLIKEWNEFEDSEQLPGYGAAVLASSGEHITIKDSRHLL